jgi:uncharacterized protein (TIGR00251 family)
MAMAEQGPISEGQGGFYLRVQVQPGSPRPGLRGVHGDSIRIGVGPHPQGGQANRALLEEVAKLFAVPDRAVTLVSGHHSRRKRLFVAGIEAAEAGRRLDRALGS